MSAALPAAPPLSPPVLSAPAPYQVSFGRVAGLAPWGAKLLIVRVDGSVVATHHVQRGRRFELWLSLPRRDAAVSVTAIDLRGRQSSASVAHVFGLPRSSRPRGSIPRLDPSLARRIVPLIRSFPGVSAVYVRDLVTGAGAAWNARAQFPAASTLKAAIAVETLRSLPAMPRRGSRIDALLRAALMYSDNEAANELEVLLGGSTSGGARRVNALMRGLGLVDSEMYGGYERGTAGRRPAIPVRVDEQPAYGYGKHTSAYDLAQLLALVHLATEGKGRLARTFGAGFSRADARYLLYLLAHVADRGKLDRFVRGGGNAVLHKAGWITSARHDAGLVYWPGGVFAVSVMTYGGAVGRPSDVLAGRVARRALTAFRTQRRTAASSGAGASAERKPVEGHGVDPGAVGVDEAGVHEAGKAPASDNRIGAVREPQEMYLSIEDIDGQSTREILEYRARRVPGTDAAEVTLASTGGRSLSAA